MCQWGSSSHCYYNLHLPGLSRGSHNTLILTHHLNLPSPQHPPSQLFLTSTLPISTHHHLNPPSSQSTLISIHPHLNPPSSQSTLISTHPHLNPPSSQHTFISKAPLKTPSYQHTFISIHPHLKTPSSQHTFISIHPHLKTPSSQHNLISRHPHLNIPSSQDTLISTYLHLKTPSSQPTFISRQPHLNQSLSQHTPIQNPHLHLSSQPSPSQSISKPASKPMKISYINPKFLVKTLNPSLACKHLIGSLNPLYVEGDRPQTAKHSYSGSQSITWQ